MGASASQTGLSQAEPEEVSALPGFDPSRGEFSSGPWHIVENRYGEFVIVQTKTDRNVVLWEDAESTEVDYEESCANAVLTMTAPELYRELHTLARVAQSFIEANPVRTAKARTACTLLYAAIDNADATLAKARDVVSALAEAQS